MPSAPVKYTAVVRVAPEVSLTGTADLGYWQEHLRGTGLFPHPSGGQAALALGAIRSKFMGLRFRELNIAVVVSQREDGSSRDGFYLVGAFNTSRFFAFCERVLFKTPYRRGPVEVQAQGSTLVRLTEGREVILHAERSARTPASQGGDDVWEGPIFLPGPAPGKQFFARLAGRTEVFPFDPAADVLTLNPTPRHPAVQGLADSRFAGTEWRIPGQWRSCPLEDVCQDALNSAPFRLHRP